MDYLLDIAKVQNAQPLKCCERLRPTERKFDPVLAVFLLQSSNFINNHIYLFSMRPRVPPSRCLSPIRELRRHRSFSSLSVSFVVGYFSKNAKIQRSDCTRATSTWGLSPYSANVTSLVAINTRNLKGLVTGVVHRLWSFSLLDPGQCLNFHFSWNFVFPSFLRLRSNEARVAPESTSLKLRRSEILTDTNLSDLTQFWELFIFPWVFLPCHIISDLHVGFGPAVLVGFVGDFPFFCFDSQGYAHELGSRSAPDQLYFKSARIVTLATSAHLIVVVVSMLVRSFDREEI